MTFTVRAAEPADAERIAELHVLTWQETYAHLLPDGFFDDGHSRMRRAMWTEILEHPSSARRVRVAEIADRLVGFAMSGPSSGAEGEDLPRERMVYNIYVSRDAHGTGAGQALLDEIVGDEPAMLWVATENGRAISFYRRNGFDFDGVQKGDPAAPKITDARMVR